MAQCLCLFQSDDGYAVLKHNLQGLDTKKMKIEIIPVRKVEEAFRALFG